MSEFSSDINKLALKNFYETHKEEYFKRRDSGDKSLWDEQYKWDILPRLNKELAKFDNVVFLFMSSKDIYKLEEKVIAIKKSI